VNGLEPLQYSDLTSICRLKGTALQDRIVTIRSNAGSERRKIKPIADKRLRTKRLLRDVTLTPATWGPRAESVRPDKTRLALRMLLGPSRAVVGSPTHNEPNKAKPPACCHMCPDTVY